MQVNKDAGTLEPIEPFTIAGTGEIAFKWRAQSAYENRQPEIFWSRRLAEFSLWVVQERVEGAAFRTGIPAIRTL